MAWLLSDPKEKAAAAAAAGVFRVSSSYPAPGEQSLHRSPREIGQVAVRPATRATVTWLVGRSVGANRCEVTSAAARATNRRAPLIRRSIELEEPRPTLRELHSGGGGGGIIVFVPSSLDCISILLSIAYLPRAALCRYCFISFLCFRFCLRSSIFIASNEFLYSRRCARWDGFILADTLEASIMHFNSWNTIVICIRSWRMKSTIGC